MSRSLLVSFSCLLILSACGDDGKAGGPAATVGGLETAQLIIEADNPQTEAKATLGKMLFFDPRLSNTGKTSCSTCHQHALAWTDGKRFSPKDDGSLNTRNSPSMYNVGYLEDLYWDGRAATLEKNVMAAWKANMGGQPEEVAKALAGVAGYTDLFQKAFATGPTGDNIGMALASFLRTLQSSGSAYDRYQAGDKTALGKEAVNGMELFFGRAGCNLCHHAPLFTDRGFHNVGIGMAAEKPDVGAGGEKAKNDPKLRGAFKTPGLRGVAKTGPWFHDGSATTLAEAVKIMASGGVDAPGNTKDPLLTDRKLTDKEIADLVAFLEALSSNEPFTAPTLPM
ncbi:MAG: c-type cytochrome [Planctomycetes bacterium]|nr:c-type cytochrome [Planctomycetota bacterium]